MLNAKGANLTASGSGKRTITPEMVAAACRKLTRHVHLYALRKFTLDESVNGELFTLNRYEVRRRARRENWHKASPHVIDRFADLVLTQAVITRHCKKCRGAKMNSNGAACKRCSGSGGGEDLSLRARARAIGISHQAYRSTWINREIELAREFDYFDRLIDKTIKREIFGE